MEGRHSSRRRADAIRALLGARVLAPLATACFCAALGLPAQAQPSPADLESRAAAIATRYLEIWSADGGRAVGVVPYIYGPTVQFHGRTYNQAALMTEKRRAVARWPQRDYRHRPGTMSIQCVEATRKCLVRSTMDWRVASPARRAAARGSSPFDLGISFAGPRPVILFESSGRRS